MVRSTQQLGSLFTPRNGQAITKALHALSHAESQQASQGLFSSGFDSVSDQQTVPAVKSQVRPSAKSLQGVYLDQPHADKAGFSALKAVSAAHRSNPSAGHGQSLSWLDEPLVDEAKPSDTMQKPSDFMQIPRGTIQLPLSHSFLSDDSVSAQKPVLRSAVLLTMVLSIATNQSEVRQHACMQRLFVQHAYAYAFWHVAIILYDTCTLKLGSHACKTQIGQHQVHQLKCKQDGRRVRVNTHTSCRH